MTYNEKWERAINPGNIDVVMMAMVEAAIALLNNPATDAEVAKYAAMCLNYPQEYAKRMAPGVMLSAPKAVDADIKSAVAGVFSAYAGVQAV